MPGWLVIVVAVVTPLLAFAGSVAGHALNRRASRELDVWRRREETMRMLRWAAELAVEDGTRAALGVGVLESLSSSELLQAEDTQLINAALYAIAAPALEQPPEDDYSGHPERGDQT